MLELTTDIIPLHVALVYNQKKENTSRQSNEGDEPPSRNLRNHPTAISSSHPQIPHNVSDLYAEWDSWETIQAVRDAIAEIHDVTLIEADEFAFERLRDKRPDIVFNMSEGMYGVSREAQIPAMLEFLQIPYTGSDPLTLAICLDKARTKEIITQNQIPTPRFITIESLNQLSKFNLSLPCIVKPLHEGSSKGIFNASVVRTRPELERQVEVVLSQYQQPALIEEFLEGREFTVALLGNGKDVTVLPIVEIKFDSLPKGVHQIYSYEAKWIWDTTDAPLEIFECPAKIFSSLQQEIELVCRQAFDVLRCRDWCRIDVRLDAQGHPHILELNPLPGILPKPEIGRAHV